MKARDNRTLKKVEHKIDKIVWIKEVYCEMKFEIGL